MKIQKNNRKSRLSIFFGKCSESILEGVYKSRGLLPVHLASKYSLTVSLNWLKRLGISEFHTADKSRWSQMNIIWKVVRDGISGLLCFLLCCGFVAETRLSVMQ